MFTSADKALTALLGAVIYFLQSWFKVDLGWLLAILTPDVIQNLIPILTPLFVYLVPNKKLA